MKWHPIQIFPNQVHQVQHLLPPYTQSLKQRQLQIQQLKMKNTTSYSNFILNLFANKNRTFNISFENYCKPNL